MNSDSLHDRTVAALNSLLERIQGHVNGMEKVVVNQGIQILYPRVEKRLRGASEDDLRTELKYLQGLLETVLKEPKPITSSPRRLGRKKQIRRN